jgi:hypothetical protein
LVLTKPFSVGIREKLHKTFGNELYQKNNKDTSSLVVEREKYAIWLSQRSFRSELIDEHFVQSLSNSLATIIHTHAPVSHGQGNYLSELLPFRNYFRTKKQSRREMKAVEKEEKRRRSEIDERRRKKSAEYLKAVLLHRDDFFRFHKNKRSGKHLFSSSSTEWSDSCFRMQQNSSPGETLGGECGRQKG